MKQIYYKTKAIFAEFKKSNRATDMLWNIEESSLSYCLDKDEILLLTKIVEFNIFRMITETLNSPRTLMDLTHTGTHYFNSLVDFPKNEKFYKDLAKMLNCLYSYEAFDLRKGIHCLESAGLKHLAACYAEKAFKTISGKEMSYHDDPSSFFVKYYDVLQKLGNDKNTIHLRNRDNVVRTATSLLQKITARYQGYFDDFSVEYAIEKVTQQRG